MGNSKWYLYPIMYPITTIQKVFHWPTPPNYSKLKYIHLQWILYHQGSLCCLVKCIFISIVITIKEQQMVLLLYLQLTFFFLPGLCVEAWQIHPLVTRCNGSYRELDPSSAWNRGPPALPPYTPGEIWRGNSTSLVIVVTRLGNLPLSCTNNHITVLPDIFKDIYDTFTIFIDIFYINSS